MSKILKLVLLSIIFSAAYVSAKSGYGPGQQDWGYVDVRESAHMFYWLYYTTANVSSYTERPLAIWLQGGPGASSTGYGNFEELGPVTLEGDYRETTWVKDMNVLFIDNPVGSGYSYVDNIAFLTATNKEIADDLVTFMKHFYKLHPEFERVPLHIFCESYGGKMAPEFALELYKAVQRGELKSNLTSVALGDPWTSPIDSVLAWAPFLLEMGIVDQDGYEAISVAANLTAELVDAERWIQSSYQWGNTQIEVMKASKGVDFYNVLKETRGDRISRMLKMSPNEILKYTMMQYNIDEDRNKMLEELMRGPVAETLGIPKNVNWGAQSSATFDVHRTDFMKPVIHVVNELLETTPLKVGVFSGHLDLICATPGTVNWIEKLEWSKRSEYLNAQRAAISVNRVLEGYQKIGGNFAMFWINRAGHMAPADNPAGFSRVLQYFTTFG